MISNAVRDNFGRIIGYIDIESNGNKVARDNFGRILGRYDKEFNSTTDQFGRIIYKGDMVASLIKWLENNLWFYTQIIAHVAIY